MLICNCWRRTPRIKTKVPSPNFKVPLIMLVPLPQFKHNNFLATDMPITPHRGCNDSTKCHSKLLVRPRLFVQSTGGQGLSKVPGLLEIASRELQRPHTSCLLSINEEIVSHKNNPGAFRLHLPPIYSYIFFPPYLAEFPISCSYVIWLCETGHCRLTVFILASVESSA